MIDPYTGTYQEDPLDNYQEDNSLPLGDEPEATLTVATSDYPQFESAVKMRVLHHLADVCTDEDYGNAAAFLDHFAQQFALRIDSMLQKFRAGQLEHGGDFRDGNSDRAEEEEVTDLMFYQMRRTTLQGLKAEIKI